MKANVRQMLEKLKESETDQQPAWGMLQVVNRDALKVKVVIHNSEVAIRNVEIARKQAFDFKWGEPPL